MPRRTSLLLAIGGVVAVATAAAAWTLLGDVDSVQSMESQARPAVAARDDSETHPVPPARASGKVVGLLVAAPRGTARAEQRVELRNAALDVWAAETDAAGRFAVEGAPADTGYVLRIVARGYHALERGGIDVKQRGTVDLGTLTLQRDPSQSLLSKEALALVGTWVHCGKQVAFDDDGTIDAGMTGATWTCDGRVLTLRWPMDNAPGGVWVDTCTLADDRKSYVGVNQEDFVVRGHRVRDP